MSADITPLTAWAPSVGRALWHDYVLLMVTALATFWEILPHLVQLGGGIIVVLTIWEKPTVQRFAARWRAHNSKGNDDAIG